MKPALSGSGADVRIVFLLRSDLIILEIFARWLNTHVHTAASRTPERVQRDLVKATLPATVTPTATGSIRVTIELLE